MEFLENRLLLATDLDFAAAAGSETGNGGLSGQHYNLNVIGVPKAKTAEMDGNNGHRIFVNLKGNSKIHLTEGDQFRVLDANGTDKDGAEFQLPNPDPDNDGTTEYSVFVRPLGKPGGNVDVTLLATFLDELGNEFLATGETLSVTRNPGQSKFENVSKELFYVHIDTDGDGHTERYNLFSDDFEGWLWDYENDGLKLLQAQLYPAVATDVDAVAAVSDTEQVTAAAVTTPQLAAAAGSETGNGGLSGQHYNLNVIGVPKAKTAEMDGNNGHRIFVNLKGNSKIHLTEGDQFRVLDANGTDKDGAEFQLPNPDPDNDGTTEYSVFVRPLGKPGGNVDVTLLATFLDELGNEFLATGETLSVTRNPGQSKFENVSKELFYVHIDTDGDGHTERYNLFSDDFEGWLWDYENDGLKLLQARFYPAVATDVDAVAAVRETNQATAEAVTTPQLAAAAGSETGNGGLSGPRIGVRLAGTSVAAWPAAAVDSALEDTNDDLLAPLDDGWGIAFLR